MNTGILEIKDVSKQFEGSEKYALNHVSFNVNAGDIVTILGTSGSGKTTLLKSLNRIYEITSGDILYKGESIYQLNGSEYRRRIGYVIQQGGLFPHWTVKENIATVPKMLKWSKQEIEARVDELLRLVKLDPEQYRDRYPSKLSGGEQQRVGIARALAAKPELILMDEPFGALDAITRRVLQEELLKLQESTKVTIIFVTHDVSEALLLGNKIIVMDKGEIQQYADPYHIIMEPANEFVAELVRTAGNFYDKLGVISASDLIGNSPQATEEAIEFSEQDSCCCSGSEHLNTVYQNLIEEEKKVCIVSDDKGKRIGIITSDQIRKLAQELN